MTEIKNVYKSYNTESVFSDFSLKIEKGKKTVILGESGSGKTTLLNMIAGLTEFAGEITKGGKVSYVFQNDSLVPSLTVFQNLKLVIKSDEKILNGIFKLGLTEVRDKYINHLSGGQKRRVNILRGLLFDSDILLLDEPFNSLDLKLKTKLIEIIKKDKRTVVMVTHDILEAVKSADRILVIKKGKIVKDIKKVCDSTYNELYNILTE